MKQLDDEPEPRRLSADVIQKTLFQDKYYLEALS